MFTEPQARLRTRTLGWGSVAAVLFSLAMFGPTTPVFYVVAIIPWVAAILYRQGQGAIHLFVGKGDSRPNLTHVYMFSGASPCLWLMTTLSRPVRWELLAVFGLIIGCLLAAVAVENCSSWHWFQIFILVTANSCDGVGVAAALNQDLDSGTPQTRTAQVLKKRIGRYRRHDSYYLELGPWGPRPSPGEVQVGKRDYDRTFVGGIACAELHPGALRISWYRAGACSASLR